MAKIRKAWHCAMYTFAVNNLRPIMLAALFILCAFMSDVLSPIKTYVLAHNEAINVWGLYTFLLCNMECVLVLGIVLLLIMGNAPFLNEAQQGILLRAGQSSWIFGQLIYVGVTTATIMLGLPAFICVYFAPHLSFSNNWGKVIHTLATLRPELDPYIAVEFTPLVTDAFSPIPAFLAAFGLRWVCYVFCMYLMFCINMLVKTRPGAFAALFVLIGDYVMVTAFSSRFFNLSISTMARLNMLLLAPNPYFPDVLPSLALMFTSFAIVTLGSLWLGSRADVGKMSM